VARAALLIGTWLFAPAGSTAASGALRSAGRGGTAVPRREGTPIGRGARLAVGADAGADAAGKHPSSTAKGAAEIADEGIRNNSRLQLQVSVRLCPACRGAARLEARAPDKWTSVRRIPHCEGEMGLGLHESYPWIDFGSGRGRAPAGGFSSSARWTTRRKKAPGLFRTRSRVGVARGRATLDAGRPGGMASGSRRLGRHRPAPRAS